MNLHVTNDSYGLYPIEIARRIKESANSKNNVIVNLYKTSVYTDSDITYISENDIAFKKFIAQLVHLDKIIFHPYNITGYRFLKIILRKFPNVKVYWMCWSYELYNLPNLTHILYEPFSTRYLKRKWLSLRYFKNALKKYFNKLITIAGIRKDHILTLQHSHSLVHYFCSPFYSDFLFLKSISPGNSIKYLPIAYLSLNKLIPDLDKAVSKGNKIMIGHSSGPDGNHFEIIEKLSTINPGYLILLPLSYGDREYANIIENEAASRFSNVEVLEKKLDRPDYYEKLTEVGWAIINAKVQQAVGNIIALVWMGCKVFLDKNTSTYKDFSAWGINIYTIQDHLNEDELSNKLSFEQMEINREKILGKFNEEVVNRSWREFLH